MDAELIYNTIEEEIVPKYYRRDEGEHSERLDRIGQDLRGGYCGQLYDQSDADRLRGAFYHKLYDRNQQMVAHDYTQAREIAAWKRQVSSRWDKVHVISVKRLDMGKEAILIGHSYDIEVIVDIDRLAPEDIGVEMILSDQIIDGNVRVVAKRELNFVREEGTQAYYSIQSTPEATGSFDMAIRVFPKNAKLPHRMDFALVKWG